VVERSLLFWLVRLPPFSASQKFKEGLLVKDDTATIVQFDSTVVNTDPSNIESRYIPWQGELSEEQGVERA